jgi:hypothetical protein
MIAANTSEPGFGSLPSQAYDKVEVLLYSQETSGASTIPLNEMCPGF